MRILFSAAIAALVCTACETVPIDGAQLSSSDMKPLDSVIINQQGVEFEFLSVEGNPVYKSGEAFSPPKTIDCSDLEMSSEAYSDAIDAGASLVRIKTPAQVQTTIEVPGQEARTEMVTINPIYGGVLALCTVSERAKGPDSRNYNIRGLDEFLVKGKDGLISAVGAVLEVEAKQPSFMDALVASQTGVPVSTGPTNAYSWMLWMTDRSTIFTNYAAE